MAAYNFDEGTTDTAACLEDGSPTTARNLRLYNASGLEAVDLWATAGDGVSTGFIRGSSTLNMTGDGTMNIPAGFDVFNLKGGASSKTTTIALPSNGSDLDVYGTLTVDGGTLTDTNNADVIIRGTAPPVVNGSSTLENLWRIQNISNMTMPATTYNILLVTSSSTCTSGGNMTFNSELEVASGSTFNANGNTINALEVDVNGTGTLNLIDSNLNFSVGSSGDELNMESTSTLLTGATTVTGYSSSSHTAMYLPPTGNFEIIGNVKWLNGRNDTDITIIGKAEACSYNGTEANFKQWAHTLDTQQLLDADEDSDDDIKLPKPSLDNALVLQTGG